MNKYVVMLVLPVAFVVGYASHGYVDKKVAFEDHAVYRNAYYTQRMYYSNILKAYQEIRTDHERIISDLKEQNQAMQLEFQNKQ